MSWRPKHKYGAKRCRADDICFDSQLERDCYFVLKRLQQAGQVRMFLMQVPFQIGAGKKHRVDFMVFTEEAVVFVEAKGRDLEAGRLRRQLAEELFDVDIHVAKKSSDIPLIMDQYG